MKLIGLTGKPRSIKRCGKDTAADMLCEIARWRCLNACKRAFADKMKLGLAEMLGMDEADIDTFKLDGSVAITPTRSPHSRHVTGREIIIAYAESHRRIFGWDFWVNELLPVDGRGGGWHHNFELAPVCVVSDLRFENEADRIRALGGEIWIIERDTGSVSDHISERGFPLRGDEKRIDNNGSLGDLQRELEGAFTYDD